MQLGDEIIAVNNKSVKTMKYDDVMHLLHTTQEPVEFQVVKSNLSLSLNTTPTTTNTTNSSNSASSCASPLAKLVSAQTAPIPSVPTPTSTPTQPPSSNHSKPTCTSPTSASSNTKNQKHLSFDLPPATAESAPPRSAQIRVGEETLVEIERGKLGLGLSIVGGSDTHLPGIIIHDIYQNGAAFRDARLRIGDQILKCNGVDLANATHEQALSALRQTSDCVKLLIHRGFQATPSPNTTKEPPDTTSFLNVLSIELNKKFAKGLGFSIIGRRDGSGVFVSHLIEGGCAHKDGRLMVGDLILEVNGRDIRRASYSDVAFLLKTLPQGKVTLRVGRFRTSATNSLSASSCVSPTQAGSAKTSRRNSVTPLGDEQK